MKVYQANGYSYITVVEIPKEEIERIDMAICQQPRETLKAFYDRQSRKPDILINGGFFSLSDGQTCFNYIDEKQNLSSDATYATGFGIIDAKTILFGWVGQRSDWRDFISAYPPLIVGGKACAITFANEINYNARRSAIGYNDQSVFIVAVDSPGVKFDVLQRVLISIGCSYAINLDGGGSTKLLQNGKCIISTLYNRPVDNVLAIYLSEKDPEPIEQVIYRVQTGAFSVKANAERLQAQIRALSDAIGAGYKSAYVRQIGGLYKVQVGAFSKKANAERVVSDLKGKGYSSFITTK